MKLPSGLYKSQPFQCKLNIGSYKTRLSIASFTLVYDWLIQTSLLLDSVQHSLYCLKTSSGTRVGVISPGVGWDRREDPLPCGPLPPRRRQVLKLISRSAIHGPDADYISRLLLLAITVADAAVDCSEPPSGKSSHPAPLPRRTCSVSPRRSSHPNSKKINMQMCNTDVRRNNKVKVVQHDFFFPILNSSEASLQTALCRRLVSSTALCTGLTSRVVFIPSPQFLCSSC